MRSDARTIELIPAALLAEGEAVAAAEHRPASEIPRDAIESYLRGTARWLPTPRPLSQPKRRLEPRGRQANASSNDGRFTVCLKASPSGI